jgi:hypothetical protein
MLNTLANHGYLPHDGKGINVNITIDALGHALNIDAELASALHNFAVTTNPTPNSTTFDLDNLSRHDILEHDASLRLVSRLTQCVFFLSSREQFLLISSPRNTVS